MARSMDLSTGGGSERRGRRPLLTVYVRRGCATCRYALEVADRARRELSAVEVAVVDLAVSLEEPPDGVFATPTFLLDREVVSLGTPHWERLRGLLEAAAGVPAGSGDETA